MSPLANDTETEAAIDQASRQVRALGFVPLRARADVPPVAARRLLHRHVVLFVTSDLDRAGAIDWIRKLSMTSPRAHLVVEFRGSRDRRMFEAATHARERAIVEHTDAGRWRDSPQVTVDWDPRERLAAIATRKLIASGELAQAEAVLNGVTAEAAIQDVAVATVTRLALAQVYFWQGRFEEARTQLDSCRMTTLEGHAWRVLTAWARADRPMMRRMTDGAAGHQQPSLVALSHAIQGDADGTCASVHAYSLAPGGYHRSATR